MDETVKANGHASSEGKQDPGNLLNLQGAVQLTPLDLNSVKLDIKHTILTPTYLESLIQNN